MPGTFDIDGLHKDMRTMLAEAKELGAELPVTAATLACCDRSAEAGPGSLNGTQQAAFWQGRAGG